MKISTITLLVSLVAVTGHATIIHVPADQPTIQDGLLASTNGDTVLVAPGTYVENVSFFGRDVVLASLFLTTGDTSYISTTIIDGDSSGSVIRFTNNESSAAVVTGLTLQNGFADPGAGILIEGAGPVISYNIITGNHSGGNGGGIGCAFEGTPEITHNRFLDNSAAGDGGAISCYITNATISDNVFRGNSATSAGAIQCGYCTGPTITGNTIIGNSSTAGAGAIFLFESNPTISLNTIDSNTAGEAGGAMFLAYCTSPVIDGNFLRGNTAGTDGGAISLYDSDPTITNNEIIGNTAEAEGEFGGGAMFFSYSEPVITGNTISQNVSARGGGGIQCIISNPRIDSNTISENEADRWGGGIDFREFCNATVYGNTIHGNTAFSGGGGIFFGDSSSVTIRNNMISGNAATGTDNNSGRGGGICYYCDDDSTREFINIVIDSNTIIGNSAKLGGGMYYNHDEMGEVVSSVSSNIFQANAVAGSSAGGGGIYCYRSPLVLENCQFFYNTSTNPAGGIEGYESDVELHQCVFQGNEAASGSAVRIRNNSLIAEECEFIDNSGIGALLCTALAEVNLTDCLFEDNIGGGMLSSNCFLDVSGCTFRGNSTAYSGGGLRCTDTAAVVLTNCEFANNTATLYGGGLSCGFESDPSNVSLTDCRFTNNSSEFGGALYIDHTLLSATGCLFIGNTSTGRGGAMLGRTTFEGTHFANCTFVGNQALPGGPVSVGGAISLITHCSLTAANCIFVGNSADEDGAITCSGGTATTLSCCDIFGNPGGDWTGCLAGQDVINNNFSLNPLFCDTVNGDYSPGDISPCAPANSPCGALVGALDVGCVIAPFAVMEPEPVLPMYANAIPPMSALVYIGNFVDGYDVSDIDPSGLMLNGSMPAQSSMIVPSHPALHWEAMEISFSMRDFILGEGMLWGLTDHSFTVSGFFGDGAPFEIEGQVLMAGHIPGDVNSDGVLDIADIISFVDYAFQGGPPPPVMATADVVCDHSLDIADLIYLVMYMFQHGPPPQPCEH
jgi:parallel beta-helix repeat protein/predicted outer membrane repeat protein